MILNSELRVLGEILKTHGLRGEMVVELADTRFGNVVDGLRHVVLSIDNIFVPFRIVSVRSRGAGSVLLTADGIESAEQAAPYTGHTVYALRKEWAETADQNGDEDEDADGLYAEDLEGFTLIRPDGAVIGEIERVDTSTANTLLHVSRADAPTCLIPLAEDWITDINPDGRTIAMDVPEELLND
ncbi:MAG: ribosome maturation factor RimM, partial [Muribaculaceae bacterium]|nr:ribosome maturation factor RimM [Muribaculaceae bacterium]